MIDQILETFKYTSAPVVGLIVLTALLGIVAIGSIVWMLARDVIGGLLSLEGFAFLVMLAAIASVAYYFIYG